MKYSKSVGGDKPESERERQARVEVETFLKALNSYPESFAHDPCLSFEQHFVAVATRS